MINVSSKIKEILMFLGWCLVFLIWYSIECAGLLVPAYISRLFSMSRASVFSFAFIVFMLILNVILRIYFRQHSFIKMALSGILLAYGFQFFMFGYIVVKFIINQ